MVIEHQIKGYDNFVQFINDLDSKGQPVFVYFTGSKIDGVSWCPDCTKAEPLVREQLQKVDPESYFIYVEVGNRAEWKNPQNPFRKDAKTRLLQIPTLIRWGGVQRLHGHHIENPELIEMLFTDED